MAAGPEQQESPFVVPDVVGEIIGFRAWYVVRLGKTTTRLYSLMSRTKWPTDDFFTASCLYGHEHPEGVPSESCTCGIYVARDRTHLVSLGYNAYDDESKRVVGEVAISGKIRVATNGYRAEKARIHKLLVPYEMWKMAKPLGDAYNVPVELDNILKTERRRRR